MELDGVVVHCVTLLITLYLPSCSLGKNKTRIMGLKSSPETKVDDIEVSS